MLEYTTPADSGVYRVMDNRTNDTINTVSVSVTVSPTVLFPLLSVLLLLGALVLLWMTVQEFKKKKKITLKHKLYLLFLVVMLLLNLVLVALSVTVTFKPGHKELYVALGAGLGLFLAFKMVIMSMTCEKLVKIRKEKTLGGTLKLVLLLLLMLLVLLVTTMMLPQQKWLNWIPFPVLGLFMILHVMIIYKPLQYFQEVMRTVQKIENSNWYEQLQELHAGLVVPLIVLLLLWVVQLVLSVVLVVKELWEGINLGLLWGLTVGDGILIMLLFLLCLHAGS
ncbi:uncharacterized protein LOC114910710 [Scleropages formosus]|uniref:uncharacterized protein LOC114910710 n=1 Tax=Scleropages formosus TaxID=113540 RepID=UPI0010FA6D3B|nr:uncharacterized protein LOC114910710 [Scleropages formosus]